MVPGRTYRCARLAALIEWLEKSRIVQWFCLVVCTAIYPPKLLLYMAKYNVFGSGIEGFIDNSAAQTFVIQVKYHGLARSHGALVHVKRHFA